MYLSLYIYIYIAITYIHLHTIIPACAHIHADTLKEAPGSATAAPASLVNNITMYNNHL